MHYILLSPRRDLLFLAGDHLKLQVTCGPHEYIQLTEICFFCGFELCGTSAFLPLVGGHVNIRQIDTNSLIGI